MTYCKRCILNDSFPGILFADDGICNYCHAWNKRWGSFNFNRAENELKKIFNIVKTKNRKYDCLLPYSGGRDSSYVLYLCKEKYGLNPLAVTFNNLFMSSYAKNNIFSMIEVLGVDHVF
ncbi:MAG: ATPase, partial [Verrucomicrobiae bacterium]|nr:ATPase [Verrucomicrobiae bacterium]